MTNLKLNTLNLHFCVSSTGRNKYAVQLKFQNATSVRQTLLRLFAWCTMRGIPQLLLRIQSAFPKIND